MDHERKTTLAEFSRTYLRSLEAPAILAHDDDNPDGRLAVRVALGMILDSPLLSYKEPDGQDDDLRHTDLKQRFYHYLQSTPDDQQVIIVENTDPPADVQSLPQALKFSGTPDDGRVGLFVVINAGPATQAAG